MGMISRRPWDASQTFRDFSNALQNGLFLFPSVENERKYTSKPYHRQYDSDNTDKEPIIQ